jgi:hypothetical protein
MSKIIEPDTKFIPRVNSSLEPQIDWAHGSVILGRDRKSVSKFGIKDTLNLGVISEHQAAGASLFGYKILFDNKFPHIIFVCGKRGSGKSYTLGVIVEELGRSSSGIGTIVVDPLGTFWTMKNKNDNKKAEETLAKYGLYPKDFNNILVLTPTGFYEEMKESVDDAFSIAISDLSVDDWCMVFDIDRFKTQGLLIGDILDKINNGYFAKVGDVTRKVPPKKKGYTIGDIIFCIQNDVNVNSPEEGYASATKRSVIARFRSAAKWGIFSVKGTPLNEISKRNQITILDVSHSKLGSSRRALLVGILARKILEARIEASRMEEATEMGISVKEKKTIPVTWLVIDEAHLLLPSTGKTAASESLVEYAKLGRKPGCGLVLATQRPAATNDDILSQVDTIFGHNLALEDDIAALKRRIPAKIPGEFNNSDFIRSIPVGMCLLADQKTQQRTMLVQIRPRMTHHSGKAALPKSDEDRDREKELKKDAEIDKLTIDQSELKLKGNVADELPIDTGLSSESEIEYNKHDDRDYQDPIEKQNSHEEPTNIMDTSIDLKEFDTEKNDTVDDGSKINYDKDRSEPKIEKDTNIELNKPEPIFEDSKENGFEKDFKMVSEILELNWGGAYIITSKDPEFGLNVLNKFSIDSPGNFLSITRTHPSKINNDLLPENINNIWLSKSTDKNSVSPGNITKLSHLIYEFLKENKNSVIFLDGVEYLINNNNFSRVLRFIELIHERIVINNAILLMPVNPSVIPRKDMDQLENELNNTIEDPTLINKGFKGIESVRIRSDQRIDQNSKMVLDPEALTGESSIDKSPLSPIKSQEPELYTLDPGQEDSVSGSEVRSATKDELIELCNKLGLDSKGTIEDLKNRLFEYEEGNLSIAKAQEPIKKQPSKAKGKDKHKQKIRDFEPGHKPESKISAIPDKDQLVSEGKITEKEKALLSTIAEERRILNSLMDERKRLEKDISKLKDQERKQKLQLERQKIRDEREKLKRDKRELEDVRKKLEKKLRLTIKQVTAAQKPTELPQKPDLKDDDLVKKPEKEIIDKKIKDVKPRERVPLNKRIKRKSELDIEIESKLKDKKKKQKLQKDKALKLDLLTQKKKVGKKKKTVIEKDEPPAVKKDLMIKPRLTRDSIEEYALKQLKTSILNKPLEVINDIQPVFLPMLKVYVKTMRGSIFAKEHSGTFYWDTVTGEIITDFGNILKRSKGLSMLISLTPTQAKILAELDTWGYSDVVDLGTETNISVAQIKRTLGTLQKRSLVSSERSSDKRIHSYKRIVELKYPKKFDKIKVEMPEIINGALNDSVITSRFKLKDLKKLISTLKPGTRIISSEDVYYPYYMVNITGKYGPRIVALDSVTGTADKTLTEFLHINNMEK